MARFLVGPRVTQAALELNRLLYTDDQDIYRKSENKKI